MELCPSTQRLISEFFCLICAKQTRLTHNMTQLCQSLDGKCFRRGDLHEKQKCFVKKFILGPKKGEEINGHFTSNRDNHIYSFESIKFHTIKATFQGESTTFLRFTEKTLSLFAVLTYCPVLWQNKRIVLLYHRKLARSE